MAIETSGHAALKENYFLDDGAYLVTKIVIELALGKDIAALLEPLKLPEESLEVRFDIKAEDFKTYGEGVISALEALAKKTQGWTIANDNREGIRVSTENGWFLLRLSVHDPVMALNLESDAQGGIDKDLKILKPFLADFTQLDISEL